MKRRVKYAKLHGTDAFLPGLGALGQTIPPTNKTLPGVTMVAVDQGVILTVPTKGIEAIIPWANFQIVQFDEEEPKESSKK